MPEPLPGNPTSPHPTAMEGHGLRPEAPDHFHRGWLITGDVAKLDEEGDQLSLGRASEAAETPKTLQLLHYELKHCQGARLA